MCFWVLNFGNTNTCHFKSLRSSWSTPHEYWNGYGAHNQSMEQHSTAQHSMPKQQYQSSIKTITEWHTKSGSDMRQCGNSTIEVLLHTMSSSHEVDRLMVHIHMCLRACIQNCWHGSKPIARTLCPARMP